MVDKNTLGRKEKKEKKMENHAILAQNSLHSVVFSSYEKYYLPFPITVFSKLWHDAKFLSPDLQWACQN
jgi:hypothetical protein